MIHHPANIMPEGKFKETLKIFYHKYIFPYNFKEVKLEKDIYEYRFKNGIKIKFHGSQFLDISSPLRGYLKQYKPQGSDVIIDLGACAGMFSIYTSKLFGKSGKIYAFEPNPNNFRKLKKNIRLNKATNIKPILGGLWNRDANLNISDDTSLSSVIYNKNKKTIPIKVTTLDKFAKENKIRKIDFIKMDVEGAELEIIDGGKETLKRMSPKLAIASYHWRDGEQTYKKVERKLKMLGYKTNTGFPSHLTTYARKK